MNERLGGLKDPVRNVSQEILSQLTVESTKVYPLQGGSGPRVGGSIDQRLSQSVLIGAGGPASEMVTFYEHIATIRWNSPAGRQHDKFFVAFRQTKDALMAEQQDPEKYPKWLMDDPVKNTELKIFIYLVTKHPKQVPNMSSFEDWLSHIGDPIMQDTLAYFLLRKGVISEQMYGRL